MKKFFAITLIFIGFAIGANAQNLTFGLKGGLNIATIANMNVDYQQSGGGRIDTESRLSFNVGAFAEYKFNRYFGISPEIVYSRQGVNLPCNIPIASNTYISKFALRLNYINVPILAKIYPFKWLSVDFGPQIGFLTATKTVVRMEMGGTTEETTNSKGFKGADFSLGMGLTFNLCKYIFMQGRYNLGLTDISKKETSGGAFQINNGKSHTNSVIQLGLGYRFGCKKKTN